MAMTGTRQTDSRAHVGVLVDAHVGVARRDRNGRGGSARRAHPQQCASCLKRIMSQARPAPGASYPRRIVALGVARSVRSDSPWGLIQQCVRVVRVLRGAEFSSSLLSLCLLNLI